MRFLTLVIALLLLLLPVMAQDQSAAPPNAAAAGDSAPQTPTLTDVQLLQLQNAILRVRLAQSELERTKADANALVHALQRPGYVLDLERMVYVPTPTPEKPAPATEGRRPN
jgi:hypothetical protein